MQGRTNPLKVCRLAQILYILFMNMEVIKLQCISSAEQKNVSGTSQIKTKLG